MVPAKYTTPKVARAARAESAGPVPAAAGLGAARLAAGTGPALSALAALATFGVVYFAGTMALRHPDAHRLWTFLR